MTLVTGEAEPGALDIAVLGSCITRDAVNTRFNPGYKAAWTCRLFNNQSALVALMSPPVELPASGYGDLTPYQRGNVDNDLSRSFLDRLGEVAPPYLLVDFFGDVHFGVLELPDGTFVTDNRWMLRRTPAYADLLAAGAQPLHPLAGPEQRERYAALWDAALVRLRDLVAQRSPGTTVVVHRGHNTTHFRTPTGRLRPIERRKQISPLDVAAANAWWRRLDDRALELCDWEAIDLTDGFYPSPPDHPWGVFYVHYDLGYYPEFLARLAALHLRRGGEVAHPLLDQMLAATRTQRDRVAAGTREIDRLARRLAAQRESRGAPARPAVGGGVRARLRRGRG